MKKLIFLVAMCSMAQGSEVAPPSIEYPRDEAAACKALTNTEAGISCKLLYTEKDGYRLLLDAGTAEALILHLGTMYQVTQKLCEQADVLFVASIGFYSKSLQHTCVAKTGVIRTDPAGWVATGLSRRSESRLVPAQ